MDKVSEALFLSNAVMFNATYVNGFVAPIYIDIRNAMSSIYGRHVIIDGMKEILLTYFPKCELIAGVSTGGIPYAAIISYDLKLPMCYVRTTEKDHGLGKKIEGIVKKGQKVVVIEDVIGSGSSAINVVLSLREAGAEVLGIVSIFTYGMDISNQKFIENTISHKSLTTFDELINVGLKKSEINKLKYDELLYYRDNIPDIAWKS